MSRADLETADVWTVLNLIVQEFKSDPTSVQCFDLRLVRRACELIDQREPATHRLPEQLRDCADELGADYLQHHPNARLASVSYQDVLDWVAAAAAAATAGTGGEASA